MYVAVASPYLPDRGATKYKEMLKKNGGPGADVASTSGKQLDQAG